MRRSPLAGAAPTPSSSWELCCATSGGRASLAALCLWRWPMGPSFPPGASTEALTTALDDLSPPDNVNIRYDAVLGSW
eukprot:46300-Chlamydomonas_euryale.AAC.1